MLTIRITGIKLQTARRLLGWSLQELATRSGVNWLTIKKYESAGDYLPPASVGALDRLVSALESAGVQFDVEGAHLDRAATMKAQVAKEINQGGFPSGWQCSLSRSASCLPPSGMTRVTGAPLMDVTRARDGWIWTCRHMPHHMALELR